MLGILNGEPKVYALRHGSGHPVYRLGECDGRDRVLSSPAKPESVSLCEGCPGDRRR